MTRRNPNWLARYIELAQISESPDFLHFWTGVSIIAGVTQRKTYFDMGTFKFIPNFYIIFVGPAGVIQKSTTIMPARKFLGEFRDKGVYLGQATTTWQNFIAEFAKAENAVAYPDNPKGLKLHYHTMSIIASELGTFLDFTNQDLINHLTDLWDAQEGKSEKGTKTQGTNVILNPVLNLLGGTTPAWIMENFQEFMIGSGFTSRCIFIHADKKSKQIPYPAFHAEKIGFDIGQWTKDLLHDLKIISNLAGAFTLTPEAQEYGIELYSKIQETLHSPDTGVELQGFYSRVQGHIHKLAMVLSLAERDDLSIDKETLIRAERIIQEAEASRVAVLASVGQTRESKVVADIRRILFHTPEVTAQFIWHRLSARADQRTIESALRTGIRAGFWTYSAESGGKPAMIRKVGM